MKPIRLFLLTCFVLVYSQIVYAVTPPYIHGDWLITGTIVAMSAPNDYVHEGYTKQDSWSIQQQGNSATLTTAQGSIQGTFQETTPEFPGGAWYFSVKIPIGESIILHMESYIISTTANTLKGAATNTYYGNSGFGWSLAGSESWVYEGLRTGGGDQTSSNIETLFNWAEVTYPDIFSPKSVTKQIQDYAYRFYSNSQIYLAVKENRVYYLGPLSQNELLDIGTLQEWIERIL